MSDNDLPLVSIVTPAYNASRYLPDLLQSVAAQDYPRIEHVVIDDGSSDDGATVRVLESYPGVRWWSHKNVGPYATMNEALRASTGDFVTVICADDMYVDGGAVDALAQCLIRHQDCDVAYGLTLHVDESGRRMPVQPYQRYPPWMLRYNLGFVFHCSLLVRRASIVRDNLLFDESFWYIADADWMYRMSQRYRFRRVERHIGAFRTHDTQRSTTASGDQRANDRRRNEHETLHRKYGTNRAIKAVVQAYDIFHQRRVKAIGAWHHGGSREVLTLAHDWVARRRGRK